MTRTTRCRVQILGVDTGAIHKRHYDLQGSPMFRPPEYAERYHSWHNLSCRWTDMRSPKRESVVGLQDPRTWTSRPKETRLIRNRGARWGLLMPSCTYSTYRTIAHIITQDRLVSPRPNTVLIYKPLTSMAKHMALELMYKYSVSRSLSGPFLKSVHLNNSPAFIRHQRHLSTMATPYRIHIAPANTGLWNIKQTEEAAQTTTETLQKELEVRPQNHSGIGMLITKRITTYS